MRLVYLGVGFDLTPILLTPGMGYYRECFERFKEKSGDTLSILDNVTIFVFVDSMPESRYFSQFCITDDHYIKYMQVHIESECGFSTTHYPEERLIYGKNSMNMELYYYYNMDCRDPSGELKAHYEEADVLYEHGFSLETGEPTPFPFIRMLPKVKHVICQWDTDVPHVKKEFPHLNVTQTMFNTDSIARYVRDNLFNH